MTKFSQRAGIRKLWQRKTFHECAIELERISFDFRQAYLRLSNIDELRRDRVLSKASMRGVEILRTLALAIRSDQDYGLTEKSMVPLGSLVIDRDFLKLKSIRDNYTPPFFAVNGSTALDLRNALNKIAHADPTQSSFRAEENTHDLLLMGEDDRGRSWLAIVSLIELCKVVRSLPDVRLPQNDRCPPITRP